MTTFAAVFALVLAYLALVTGYLALRTLARLRASASVLAKPAADGRGRSLVEIAEEQMRLTEAVSSEIETVRAELQAQREVLDAAVRDGQHQIDASLHQSNNRLDAYRGEIDSALAHALRNVALVRYDAFDDLAGRMSFTVAMLDDNADGLILTSIAGRSDTRVYAKGVQGGRSEYELSPEEQQAITAAVRRRTERAAAERTAERAAARRRSGPGPVERRAS